MTRTEKWAEKREELRERDITMDLMSLQSQINELNDRADYLEKHLDALAEIVKYLDTREESAKAFDDMFDSPLETLEEIFKL